MQPEFSMGAIPKKRKKNVFNAERVKTAMNTTRFTIVLYKGKICTAITQKGGRSGMGRWGSLHADAVCPVPSQDIVDSVVADD